MVEAAVGAYLAGAGSYRAVAVELTGAVPPTGTSITDALMWTTLTPGFQRVHAWVARVAATATADAQRAAAWVTARVPTSTVVDHQSVPLSALIAKRTRDATKRGDLASARLLARIFTDVTELNPARTGWLSAWLRFVALILRRSPWRSPPRSPPEPRTS